MTKAGVGFSRSPDSAVAGVEAARKAVERSGEATCDVALFFATSQHDQKVLLEGVRAVVGSEATILGGYGIGVITNEAVGYEGSELGVAVLSSDTVRFDAIMEPGLPGNEHAVGLALGKSLREAGLHDPNVVLLYEPIREATPQGPLPNSATPLLQGLGEGLDGAPPIVGGALLGDFQWRPKSQCLDNRIEEQSALALAVSGDVRMDTVVMHSLRPMSGYHTVTKADRGIVFEIDRKPAMDAIEEILGTDPDTLWNSTPPYFTLGWNRGDKFGPYREEDYVNQNCFAVDRDRKALVLNEWYLTEGTEFQVMRREIDFSDVRRRVRSLLDRLEDRRPFFALYIDCAGRTATFANTEGEEADEVRTTVGDIPLLGLYSGGEISRFGGDVFKVDYTGVLNIFSEPATA